MKTLTPPSPELLQRMRFLLEGIAIMQTLRQSNPVLQQEITNIVREWDEEIKANA